MIPADSLAAGTEMLACWCFVMGALACYKLAYLGQGRLAYGYGALHLALAGIAFALSPSGPDVCLMLAAVELLLVTWCSGSAAGLGSARVHTVLAPRTQR